MFAYREICPRKIRNVFLKLTLTCLILVTNANFSFAQTDAEKLKAAAFTPNKLSA